MKLLSLIFFSGLLSNLQIANALPSSDMRIQKRTADIPAIMAADGLDLKVYALDGAEHAKLKDQLGAISHESPPTADFTLGKTFPGLQEFETSVDAPTKKHQIVLATPKGSDKVVGYFDFELGMHYTKADLEAGALIGSNKEALLGLKWVHGDYRGITEGKGLLGTKQGTPYNLNMAITEAGMQIIQKDGHKTAGTLFATEAGMKSGQNQGFKILSAGPGYWMGELDMDTRPTWESRVETLNQKLAAKAAAPAC